MFTKRAFIIFLFVMVLSAPALGSDWKYLGDQVWSPSSQLKAERDSLFYDAGSVEYLPNGNVKLWIKFIELSDHNKEIMGKKEVIDKAKEKLAQGYQPPYALLNPGTTPNDCLDITRQEEAVNDAQTITRAMMYYELNCGGKLVRILSETVYNDAGEVLNSWSGGQKKWTYIGPNTSDESLSKLLCK